MKFIYAKSKVKTETFKSTCLFNTLEGIPVLKKMCQCKLQDAKLAGKVAAAAQKHRVRLVLPSKLLQPNEQQYLTSPASFCRWLGNAGVKAPVPPPPPQQGCLRVSGCTTSLQSPTLIPDAIVRQEKQSHLFIRLLK